MYREGIPPESGGQRPPLQRVSVPFDFAGAACFQPGLYFQSVSRIAEKGYGTVLPFQNPRGLADCLYRGFDFHVRSLHEYRRGLEARFYSRFDFHIRAPFLFSNGYCHK